MTVKTYQILVQIKNKLLTLSDDNKEDEIDQVQNNEGKRVQNMRNLDSFKGMGAR